MEKQLDCYPSKTAEGETVRVPLLYRGWVTIRASHNQKHVEKTITSNAKGLSCRSVHAIILLW